MRECTNIVHTKMSYTKFERNVMKCPDCGFMILTIAKKRNCAKCETKLVYICKEKSYKKK